MKTTLKNVLTVIKKWSDDNDVMFYGSFVEFNKKGDVKDDIIIGFGDKKMIKISLSEFNKMLKEEKENFVNW